MLAVLGALVTLTCWAISSPPGSAPDELYHLNSIWCGHGIDEDLCLQGADEDARLVPHQVTTPQCFTQNGAQSAECRPADIDDPMTPDASTDIGNWESDQYPDVYYFVMSAFVLDGFDASVILMRIVNGILAVLLVAGLAVAAPPPIAARGPLGVPRDRCSAVSVHVGIGQPELLGHPQRWHHLAGGLRRVRASGPQAGSRPGCGRGRGPDGCRRADGRGVVLDRRDSHRARAAVGSASLTVEDDARGRVHGRGFVGAVLRHGERRRRDGRAGRLRTCPRQ